jgi:hypothetical protein
MGSSPFHDYETWIEKAEMVKYFANRAEGPATRNMPKMTDDAIRSLVTDTLEKK